jgi:hypothetical protein
LQPNSKDDESDFDYPSTYSIECIHDIRLVWSPQTPGNEDFHQLAADPGDIVLMGSSLP